MASSWLHNKIIANSCKTSTAVSLQYGLMSYRFVSNWASFSYLRTLHFSFSLSSRWRYSYAVMHMAQTAMVAPAINAYAAPPLTVTGIPLITNCNKDVLCIWNKKVILKNHRSDTDTVLLFYYYQYYLFIFTYIGWSKWRNDKLLYLIMMTNQHAIWLYSLSFKYQ